MGLGAVVPAPTFARGGVHAAACDHAAPAMSDLECIFAPEGPLAAAVPGSRPRPLLMAK